MGTSSAVTVTPIYWAPSGLSYPSTYKSLTEQFLTNVAHDDGLSTNVFANLRQYTDAGGDHIMYNITVGFSDQRRRRLPEDRGMQCRHWPGLLGQLWLFGVPYRCPDSD